VPSTVPSTDAVPKAEGRDRSASLYHLLDPDVLANPYPLFHRLRSESPVYWDPFLHAWVVTRYADVLEVLLSFSADRTPTPAQLDEMGLSSMNPIAKVMVKQMLFMDAPAHTRLRALSAKAFTPARVEQLRGHIKEIMKGLLDGLQGKEQIDVIADIAEPLPAIVTAEMLGVPTEDHVKLKEWSADFAEMLGNFQHNPERYPRVLKSVANLTEYFQNAVREQRQHPREGLIHSLLTAEVDGDRLTEEEVVANCIVTMVGGQETTTNLIGNGLMTLLRHPEEMERLRNDLSLIPSAVEEMLRYESPSQHTARMCPSEREMGGKLIQKRQAVIAVMAAANRDPERFPDPDKFDIARTDNRHLAFGYAAHYCFGAPLARVEGQIAFEALLRRFPKIVLSKDKLEWRSNLGLRGLKKLEVKFVEAQPGDAAPVRTQATITAGSTVAATTCEFAPSRKSVVEKYLSERLKGSARTEEKIVHHAEQASTPLSLGQEELLRREFETRGTAPLYNECVLLRMQGSLDVAALEKSFNEIVRRHSLWRSSVVVENGHHVMKSCPATPVSLPVIDLRDVPAAAREAEVLRTITAICQTPFQLSGPFLRPTLVRMADDEHRLYLVAHLLVLDGMSAYQIFPSELASLYKAFSRGSASPLPELTVQYGDFAAWQRERVQADAGKQMDYWRQQLGDKPIANQPIANQAPTGQPFRGAVRPFTLRKDLSDRIKAFSRTENSTLFVTLLAGFAILAHRYTNETDVVFGTPSPCGREREEFSGLLGYFLNPVAMRLDLTRSGSFREVLAQAREVMCEAIDHDDVPVEHVARELAPQSRYAHNPFFRAAISLQPPMPNVGLPWSVTSMDVDSGGSPWDLYVAFIDRQEGLTGRIQYNPDVIDVPRIEQGVRDFETLMEALIAEPGRRLSEIGLKEPQENSAILCRSEQ
jgi:pimeloyl-[acyl-carrier protein] synthase